MISQYLCIKCVETTVQDWLVRVNHFHMALVTKASMYASIWCLKQGMRSDGKHLLSDFKEVVFKTQ